MAKLPSGWHLLAKVNYLGVALSAATLASLLLPWWSIRASGVSIDIYPFRVMALNVPTYDADWVVGRLLTLDSVLLTVGLLLVVSIILTTAGSLKFPPLLITPVVLNLSAAFIFHGLMRSAIGKLAYGPFSGTNLIPVGPWGFALGIGICVLAGLASPISLIARARLLRRFKFELFELRVHDGYIYTLCKATTEELT